MKTRPLVMLDVDGVVNYLGPRDIELPFGMSVQLVSGWEVAIPDFMPALIRRLAKYCDVWWCSTWRAEANDELIAILGIDPLPVVEVVDNDGTVYWKVVSALPILEDANAAGRATLWIEDFAGEIPPGMPEWVTIIDTGYVEVLQPSNLPEGLLE